MDKSIVKHAIKNQQVIKELAEFSVAFTFSREEKSFSTRDLSDKSIRNKFHRNGYGGIVTVTYGSSGNNVLSIVMDSTVIFKQMGLNGVTEIIYDFAANQRKWQEDVSNPKEYILLRVADRIYYRRRPVPMM